MPTMSAPLPKKRRTFFKSSNLSFLPSIPSTTSKPIVIPRDKILAPLLDDDQRRDSTPASDKALRARKPRTSDQSTATASTDPPIEDPDNYKNDQKALFIQRKTRAVETYGRPRKTTTQTLVVVRRTISTRPVRNKLRVIPSNAAPPPPPPPKKVRITAPFTPPKQRGVRANASTAQSSNERLALAMQQAMRATVGGRTAPYERVPVWSGTDADPEEKPGIKPKGKRGRPVKGIKSRRNGTAGKVRIGRKRKEPESESEEGEAEELEEPNQEAKPLAKKRGTKTKEYMTSGFYCQDPNPESPFKLVNQVLNQGSKASGSSRRGKGKPQKLSIERMTFPPMPYYEGQKKFLEEENEFVLPFHIHAEVASGILDRKKKPTPYQKLRGNMYPERPRRTAGFKALCKCDAEYACGENCINRITNYLCGRDCPAGDACQNRSLAKRTQPLTQVFYTGSRGFGLKAMEDIKAESFVTDYRGEVIDIDSFKDRIEDEYAGQKNFYALSYSRDEVIDAGMRGNDARFINHGCDPNLEVRKCQNLGDGLDEFEIGMWATRDIAKGEELFYNYNFDDFGAREDPRTPCHCGATTCSGFLGRRSGDKTAREIRQEVEAEAKRAAAARKGKGRVVKVKVTIKSKVGTARSRLGKPGRAKVQKAIVRARATAVKKEKARIAKTVKAPRKKRVTSNAEAGPSTANAQSSNMDDAAIVDATIGGTTASSSSAPLPITPDEPFSEDDSASGKRKSGWASWLLKLAGTKTRSLEEWHEERIKRRRGVDWMNEMIEEYGVLPQPEGFVPNPDAYADGSRPAGSKGSYANTLAARGLGPGPAHPSTWRGEFGSASPPPGGSVGPSAPPSITLDKPKKKRGRPFKNAFPTSASLPNGFESLVSPTPTPQNSSPAVPFVPSFAQPNIELPPLVRVTHKKEQIKRRNGAPMGWSYVIGEEASVSSPSRLVSVVETNLDRSARRAKPRASMP